MSERGSFRSTWELLRGNGKVGDPNRSIGGKEGDKGLPIGLAVANEGSWDFTMGGAEVSVSPVAYIQYKYVKLN